jgi:hypothetical protein
VWGGVVGGVGGGGAAAIDVKGYGGS